MKIFWGNTIILLYLSISLPALSPVLLKFLFLFPGMFVLKPFLRTCYSCIIIACPYKFNRLFLIYLETSSIGCACSWYCLCMSLRKSIVASSCRSPHRFYLLYIRCSTGFYPIYDCWPAHCCVYRPIQFCWYRYVTQQSAAFLPISPASSHPLLCSLFPCHLPLL